MAEGGKCGESDDAGVTKYTIRWVHEYEHARKSDDDPFQVSNTPPPTSIKSEKAQNATRTAIHTATLRVKAPV